MLQLQQERTLDDITHERMFEQARQEAMRKRAQRTSSPQIGRGARGDRGAPRGRGPSRSASQSLGKPWRVNLKDVRPSRRNCLRECHPDSALCAHNGHKDNQRGRTNGEYTAQRWHQRGCQAQAHTTDQEVMPVSQLLPAPLAPMFAPQQSLVAHMPMISQQQAAFPVAAAMPTPAT